MRQKLNLAHRLAEKKWTEKSVWQVICIPWDLEQLNILYSRLLWKINGDIKMIPIHHIDELACVFFLEKLNHHSVQKNIFTRRWIYSNLNQSSSCHKKQSISINRSIDLTAEIVFILMLSMFQRFQGKLF